jgi:hypothetical protein
MATKQTSAQTPKTTKTTFTVAQDTGSADALKSIKAQQDELAKQAKDIRESQRALAAKVKAQSVKSLSEVIASEPTDPKAWSNRRIVRTGAARVSRRVKAGQDHNEAINQVVAKFRTLIETVLDSKEQVEDDEDEQSAQSAQE